MSRDDNARVNIFTKVLMWLVTFYREAISPLTPPSCRFQPTCSEYTLEALRVHGAVRGTALGVWRILRCAPWSRGGWDPVPPPRGGPPPTAADEHAHPHEYVDENNDHDSSGGPAAEFPARKGKG